MAAGSQHGFRARVPGRVFFSFTFSRSRAEIVIKIAHIVRLGCGRQPVSSALKSNPMSNLDQHRALLFRYARRFSKALMYRS
jgi:hypothetical protein